jgi:hypothetical protein
MPCNKGGRRGRMVVGFPITDVISAYYHYSCEFESRSWRGVLDTTLCDKVCQQLATGRWFLRFPPPIKLTADIKRNILLRVALNIISETNRVTRWF